MHNKNDNLTKARIIALSILNSYELSSQLLDKIIESKNDDLLSLSKRDRALSNEIVFGVLRWQKKLDWIIKNYSSKKTITKVPPIILNIIRIGLFQILFMDRIPKFAAVNTSVNLAKSNMYTKRLAGFVNAILRNIIRKNNKIKEVTLLKKSSLDQLSINKSFPKWLLKRWIKRFGYTKTSIFCDTINTIPPIFIRINTLRVNKNILKKILVNEVKEIRDFEYLPDTLIILKPNKPIHKMKSFMKGMFSIQDGAAQMVSHIIAPKPNDIVLDACSGLGGKSTHMAQLMKNQGEIIAIDNIESKLKKLEKDAKRLGITIIQTEHQDLLSMTLNSNKYPKFDHILLDAPCSGLGVISRNPDTKWSSSNNHLLNCSKKQIKLLNNVSSLLKVEGKITYAVCSIEPEENEHIINSFLKENSNFEIDKQHILNIDTKKINNYLEKDCFFRIYPNIQKIDSFFIALLRRKY